MKAQGEGIRSRRSGNTITRDPCLTPRLTSLSGPPLTCPPATLPTPRGTSLLSCKRESGLALPTPQVLQTERGYYCYSAGAFTILGRGVLRKHSVRLSAM